jgi:hypothetical protein
MRTVLGLAAAVVLVALLSGATRPFPAREAPQARRDVAPAPGVRFLAVDVILDAGASPLAAYQFEFMAPPGVRLVGVEGGAHPAFADAPRYDPAALQRERVIVAAFSTDEALPAGPTRVARLHLMAPIGAPNDFALEVIAAADGAGARLDPAARTQTTEGAQE